MTVTIVGDVTVYNFVEGGKVSEERFACIFRAQIFPYSYLLSLVYQ